MLQWRFTTTPSRVSPPSSTQLPGNVAAPHDAHDLAPDLLLDHWSPRNQTEAEPVINHREPAACELHGTEQFAADSLALLNGMEGQTPLRRELPTDALDLLTAQGVDEVGSRPELAGGGSPALTPPDQLVFALLERIQDLSTKSAAGNRAAIGVHDVPVQPSCAIARHLLVEIEGREHSHAETGSARGIILGGAGLEVLGNPPPVGIEPLNNPGPAERFQAAHMSADIGVVVSTGNRSGLCLDKISVNAGLIFPRAARELSDGAVRRTLRRVTARPRRLRRGLRALHSPHRAASHDELAHRAHLSPG